MKEKPKLVDSILGKRAVFMEAKITFKFEASMTEKDWEKTKDENKMLSESDLYYLMHGHAAAVFQLIMAELSGKDKVRTNHPLADTWNQNHRMIITFREDYETKV